MDKNLGRRIGHSLTFGGRNVDKILKDYIESLTYTDVAAGSSDTLSITLENIRREWLTKWYPRKGNVVSGKLRFYNWHSDGKDKSINCGTFTLDDIDIRMMPSTAQFSCISSPADESFKTRERDKTWERVTIQEIAMEICSRYSLQLTYEAPSIMIQKLEQSETDSSFLSKLCDDYGLSMKIYRPKIVIYDICSIEDKRSVKALHLKDFEDISFRDGLYGTYTGAKVSYKAADDDKEIEVFVGLKDEHEKGSRVLKVNSTCESEEEAIMKGAAQVNKSNMKATTMTATLFPDPSICSGVCITLGEEFGKLKGKYFIDKVTWTISGSGGTRQQLEAHQVKKKIVARKALEAAEELLTDYEEEFAYLPPDLVEYIKSKGLKKSDKEWYYMGSRMSDEPHD